MDFPLSVPLGFDQDATDPAEKYARQVKALLPPGSALHQESDSALSKVALAVGGELAHVEARGQDLLAEADPRTAAETLDDWERVYGLPDAAISTIPSSIEARRLAVTQKAVAIGGQTPAYFVSLAAACGYTATVYDSYGSLVLRAGFTCGALSYGTDWAFAWRMDVQPPAGAVLSHAELEAVIRRVAPAHTQVIFNYL